MLGLFIKKLQEIFAEIKKLGDAGAEGEEDADHRLIKGAVPFAV